MMSFARRTLFACVTAAFALAPAAHAATVVNGGFETGDFTGWTLFGNTGAGFVGVDNGAPQAGTYGAYFGPAGADGGISQLVATTAGTLYDVGFWLKSEADPNGVATPNSFTFNWGGAPAVMLTDLAPVAYTHYTRQLLATSASTSLSFSFRDEPAFFDFDSVSVDAAVTAAVPEPSSYALLVGGGLLVAGYRLRQQQKRRA